MTEEDVVNIALKAYLQALDDTNTIIKEVMEKSIAFYKQKIKQHEENFK